MKFIPGLAPIGQVMSICGTSGMNQVVLKQSKRRCAIQENTTLTDAITAAANATKDELQEGWLLTFPFVLEVVFHDGREYGQSILKRIALLFDFLADRCHQFRFSIVHFVFTSSLCVFLNRHTAAPMSPESIRFATAISFTMAR